MTVRISLELPDPEYFNNCARIRDVALHSLLRRLLATIAEDEMVAAILDDADCLRERRQGEHRWRGKDKAL